MAAQARDPYRNFNFRVAIGGRTRAADGYSEVQLPTFITRSGVVTSGPANDAEPSYLVLRRGYTGALDLYDWWDQERRAPKKNRGRIVTVELLDESGVDAVTTWRFTGCRPVALQYSPLNALEAAVVVETITLTVDDVEMT